jgi:hypothetical protein
VCLLEVPSSGIDRDRPPSTVAGARERSAVVGVLAGLRPARRAGRLAVLRAIGAE